MDEHILNILYHFTSGFGVMHRKTILELAKEHFPDLDEEMQNNISIYLVKVRKDITNYFFERYNYKNDSENSILQKDGLVWIKQNYSWMNEDNIKSSIGEGMYFGWHG